MAGFRSGSSARASATVSSSACTPAPRWMAANSSNGAAPASVVATTRPPFGSYSMCGNCGPSSSANSAVRLGHRAAACNAMTSSGPGDLSDTKRLPSPPAVVADATVERSMTVTSTPSRARLRAQAAPTMPAPMTITLPITPPPSPRCRMICNILQCGWVGRYGVSTSSTGLDRLDPLFGSGLDRLDWSRQARPAFGSGGLRAEVCVDDARVGDHLGGLALERGRTVLDDIRAVGDLKRCTRVLLHQQHRGSLAANVADDLHHLRDDQRRKTHRRLVEHQHLRAGNQCAPDREHLLFATGESAALLVLPLLEQWQQLVDVLDALGNQTAVLHQVSTQLQVLVDRQGAEDPPPFRNVDQSGIHHVPWLRVGDIGAVEGDSSCLRGDQRGCRRQCRRLARTVVAEQRDYLTLVHADTEPAQGLHLAVEDLDVVELKHCHQRAPPHHLPCPGTLRSPRGSPSLPQAFHRRSPCRSSSRRCALKLP